MSAWMNHVKAVKRAHPNKSLKEVLKMASKTYKKSGLSVKKTQRLRPHVKQVKRAKPTRPTKTAKKMSNKSHRKSRRKSHRKSRRN